MGKIALERTARKNWERVWSGLGNEPTKKEVLSYAAGFSAGWREGRRALRKESQ